MKGIVGEKAWATNLLAVERASKNRDNTAGFVVQNTHNTETHANKLLQNQKTNSYRMRQEEHCDALCSVRKRNIPVKKGEDKNLK